MAEREREIGSEQGRGGGRGAFGARTSTSVPESRTLRSSSPFAAYRLPAGRSSIPRELAAENQRWRMLGATALILFEEGYAHTTVAKVAGCAGVSRKTFYEHFDDLAGCMLATYEMAAGSLLDAVQAACEEAEEGEDPVAVAARRGLEFAAAEPTLAYLLGVETPVGLPALAAQWEKLIAKLASLLALAWETEAQDPSELPSIGQRAMVGAALVLVADQIGRDGGDDLDVLEPSLTALLGRATAPPAIA